MLLRDELLSSEGAKPGNTCEPPGASPPFLVQVTAVDVGGQLAAQDAPALVAERGTERDVDGVRKSERHLARGVRVHDQLVATDLTREERGLVRDTGVVGVTEDAVVARRGGRDERGPERDVQRVLQLVAETVVPVARARVHVPAARPALHAAGHREVGDLGPELRQVAERIDVVPVAVTAGVAAIAFAVAEPVAVAAEGVELPAAQRAHRQVQVGHGEHVLLQAVAPVMVGLRHRVVLGDHLTGVRVDHVCHAAARDLEGVRPRAVRGIAVEVFRRERERARAHGQSPRAARVHVLAVVRIVCGEVLAAAHAQRRREPPALHDQVDHARDGVGAVLGRGTVPQHLDVVDGAARDGIHVDAARARGHAVRERVDERGLVPAQPVDQHQRLVGREAAQRERPHDVRRVRDALVREVDRGCDRLKRLAGLARALAAELLGREHVDGHRELIGRGVPCPRADQDLHALHREHGALEGDVHGRGPAGLDGDRAHGAPEAEHERAHDACARRHSTQLEVSPLVGHDVDRGALDPHLGAAHGRTRAVGDGAREGSGRRRAAGARIALCLRQSRETRHDHQ
jgi:hypothetical protein